MVPKYLIVAMLAVVAPLCHATDSKSEAAAAAAAHYERMRATTTLDAPGKSPFHIKIAFQLYDLRGKPSSTGTVEEWWAPSVGQRIVITSPTLNETEPLPEGTSLPPASRDGALIHELLREFIHPLNELPPKTGAAMALTLSEEPRKVGQTMLTCIVEKYDSIIATRDCTMPGKDDLRLRMYGTPFTVVRNRPATFRGSQIALEETLSYGPNESISGQVAGLQAIDAAEVGLDPGKDAASPVVPALRISGKDLRPDAGERHLSGSVVFEIVVGKDGKVSSTAIIYSADKALTDAVTTAVPTWRFTPALQNGKPVETTDREEIQIRTSESEVVF